jgi:ring-1,2-phenylacetyl-CoA epoxidase subunit PaaC
MTDVFEKVDLPPLENKLGMKNGDGRKGEHTKDLEEAILTLGEVYNSNPAAVW